MIFEPFSLGPLRLPNRVLRSSLGGRFGTYDGGVAPAFSSFEKHFARTGVSALISATLAVNDLRWSPLEYPKLSQDRFVPGLRAAIEAIHALDCRYIVQIGDPGAHTQTSLLPQAADARSASATFDLLYGYTDRSIPMTVAEIAETVDNFRQAARRVREAGADGVEVTISKGYLLQQFLNPATNRRRDDYGGSVEKRFRIVREVIEAVREAAGPGLVLGVRQSARDYNWQPLNLRWPPVWPLRHYVHGNGLEENLFYARELERLGVDYLHVDSGFGFVNPNGNPGRMPVDEVRIFVNATRHLSRKARARAMLVEAVPAPLLQGLFDLFGRPRPGANTAFAKAFKGAVTIPVIANGGFQERDAVEAALREGACDLVALARPLLANADLLRTWAAGQNLPERPCSHCGKCCIRTSVMPVGCYDRARFGSDAEMEAAILALWQPED